MAGIEQLEIHSKSYLVRWIDVAAGHTISWSIQPHKRSISFGVFKHPGNPNGLAAAAASLDIVTTPSTDSSLVGQRHVSTSVGTPPIPSSRQEYGSAKDKLQSLGMKVVDWSGRCEADQVSTGRYNVPEGEGGMYGLVFDNTHSKQISKTVTFVLMTYPTKAPPKSGHQIHFKQAMARKSSTSIEGTSPNLHPSAESYENPPHDQLMATELRSKTGSVVEWDTTDGGKFYTGVLAKKRRKRNQGWAKRFFSLDFTSSTLSYYRSRSSASLRGAIPLFLAAIGADEKNRQISIDSGAEVWLLRAPNAKVFEGWKHALDRAARQSSLLAHDSAEVSDGNQTASSATLDSQWASIEPLVGRVAGITDSVRRLAYDTEPTHSQSHHSGLGIKDGYVSSSLTPSPTEHDGIDYFSSRDRSTSERPGFWRRKSRSGSPSPAGFFRRSSSAQKTSGSSLTVPPRSVNSLNIPKRQTSKNDSLAQMDIHDRCTAILKDLDSVVAEFSSLITQTRQIRFPERPIPASRVSLESTMSQEYYDAQDGIHPSQSQILKIHGDNEAEESPERDWVSIGGDSVSSADEMYHDEDNFTPTTFSMKELSIVPRPESLTPLPAEPVARRSTIPPSSGSPPSLISFLRKNVGKDLSTIAMPVTANEPLSLLQREAEQLEYSELLDSAIRSSPSSGERLLYIAAFAISALSNARLKDRAVRKPFNPMLGETYELVREDKGFRFLAEKISHRPVRVACQAESQDWTFLQAPSPSQKFWGKSAELIVDGRARVFLHSKSSDSADANNECYSWAPATCFLRNIIAGEKYVEPVQNMTILEESSGRKAVVTFKSGGVFSGRSELVTVQAFESNGTELPLSLTGRWTEELTLTSNNSSHTNGAAKQIWKAGPLVQDPAKHYGMTKFSATLNEITSMEEEGGRVILPPTDSRRRPDQRAYEEGDIDKAEKLKVQLEESQRRRRKEMETSGETWQPRWFEKVEGDGLDDVWRLKGEREGADYWGVRAAVIGFKHGKWDGVREVFET